MTFLLDSSDWIAVVYSLLLGCCHDFQYSLTLVMFCLARQSDRNDRVWTNQIQHDRCELLRSRCCGQVCEPDYIQLTCSEKL